jgi:hypothetical protein
MLFSPVLYGVSKVESKTISRLKQVHNHFANSTNSRIRIR